MKPLLKSINGLVYKGLNMVLLGFTSIIVLIGGCDQQNQINEKGILEGIVTIGPLCPVESFPPDPSCQPTDETYRLWPIAVWTLDKKTKIGQLQPATDGAYSIELPQGKFIVDLEFQHSFGKNLPATINIDASTTVVLNIDIDTGIR